ncbi:nucleoside-diphosphate sugar epimerase [Pseudoxanthomonas winnipegensis]|jgi:mitochondrial fission protein ELM1|uniref:Nucleoside-diphosphate sugar epimerase n=1 Tax=Pseudoxanthomonas winnipegensis TaxID=2480810 RepID=A0ABY1WI42_9GAMM|nr:mitochondrial fission ELM1 family protein [Pseudoxanthomonas winnipegensis]TAA10200.1 nucleoside-diphosphate sugar epimerase [Pseudoxanthomonas winnipegensis]TAA22419.1 nucleoside-diphosphate sugar epimerase [Pseudoxanthomonas winnipegensis]TAH70109.1 nucleoside-diphosphate sugar epimerase [Pseudoxanthomonas winnipegensis]
MTPARTWTLTDGHAGNVRQTEALARALRLPAQAWTLRPRAPWKTLAPRWLPGADQAFGPDFAQALAAPPQLAIGCGRQAALATRLLRARGAQAVQILDPRLAPRHWDLVIAPEHDGLRAANVLTLLGSLHPVDDAWLAQARADFPSLGALPGPRTALLVGGPSAHARLEAEDLATITAALDAALRAHGGTVMATVSRRTPPALVETLRRHYAGTPHLVWTGAQDGPNPYPGLLAFADRIVCTADSVNMLSEACATSAPVFVHAPQRVRGRPAQFIAALQARGRIAALDAGLAPFAITPLRETARIAALVRERLGGWDEAGAQ